MVSTLKAQVGPEHSEGRDPVPETHVQLGTWKATEESVLRYIQAVGDTPDLYLGSRLAPPLALTAWTLGEMLQHLDLPPGAIHSLQEMETLRGVGFGEQVTAVARLGQPRRRGGLEFINAAYTLRSASGDDVMRGQSTVLVNRNVDSGARVQDAAGDPAPGQNPTAYSPAYLNEPGATLVERTITQERLNDYAQASGDLNPLHLDPEFAATTQFGGIIAHGMLTLAFVSEAMAKAYGKAWLETGALKVRFKGAAYLGDKLYAHCQTSQKEVLDGRLREVCAVAVREGASGRELVNGTASVIIGGENSG